MLKKARKLARDPDRFFLDLFRKRAGVDSDAGGSSKHLVLQRDDYDVVHGLLVISDRRACSKAERAKKEGRRIVVSFP